MSADINVPSDEFEEDGDDFAEDIDDTAETKALNSKASLMKRRLIDELLFQKKLDRNLEDFNFDLEDE